MGKKSGRHLCRSYSRMETHHCIYWLYCAGEHHSCRSEMGGIRTRIWNTVFPDLLSSLEPTYFGRKAGIVCFQSSDFPTKRLKNCRSNSSNSLPISSPKNTPVSTSPGK